jgi:hypothetical protein
MTKLDYRIPAPQVSQERDRMVAPIERRDLSPFAITDGFIEFRSSSEATFVFAGHRIHQIFINGDVAYTFTHSVEGVLEKVVNHLRGTELTFSYNIDGTILNATSDDAA